MNNGNISLSLSSRFISSRFTFMSLFTSAFRSMRVSFDSVQNNFYIDFAQLCVATGHRQKKWENAITRRKLKQDQNENALFIHSFNLLSCHCMRAFPVEIAFRFIPNLVRFRNVICFVGTIDSLNELKHTLISYWVREWATGRTHAISESIYIHR